MLEDQNIILLHQVLLPEPLVFVGAANRFFALVLRPIVDRAPLCAYESFLKRRVDSTSSLRSCASLLDEPRADKGGTGSVKLDQAQDITAGFKQLVQRTSIHPRQFHVFLSSFLSFFVHHLNQLLFK